MSCSSLVMEICDAQPQACRLDRMASEPGWRPFTRRSTMPARISPPSDYGRISTPRWGSLPAHPRVSPLNAIPDRESGQEQYQQLQGPTRDSFSEAMSTKSPGKKSSFINRSFRKLRTKFKPKPVPISAEQTDSARQRLMPHQAVQSLLVSTPASAAQTQVGGGGRPRIASTNIKTFSSKGRLLGKKAPLNEGKITKGSSASHATSVRGTISATRQPPVPESAFSTGCAGGTVASNLQQPSKSNSNIVSLQTPLQLPPSTCFGASGSDFGLLPSAWCLSNDDEDDDVEGCKGHSKNDNDSHRTADGATRIEDSKAGDGRAADVAVLSPRRCRSWGGGRGGAGGSSAVWSDFKDYGEDSRVTTGRKKIGTGRKGTNNSMMVGMSGIGDRIYNASNNNGQLSATFLANDAATAGNGETVSYRSSCSVDGRNRVDRQRCKAFGSPSGDGLDDHDDGDGDNDDTGRCAGAGRGIGGDGMRTPRTSRSPAGSPGLTPLRGRSRRGWWRRRRDSYPSSAH